MVSGRPWGLRSLFLHDASTANHSARADRLAFQFAVSPASCLQRHAQHPPAGVPLLPLLALRPLDLMIAARCSILLVVVVRIAYLFTLSLGTGAYLFADIAFVAARRALSWDSRATLWNNLALVYRWHQYSHKQHWTRLAGDVVGGSQSIHCHLIPLGLLPNLSPFGRLAAWRRPTSNASRYRVLMRRLPPTSNTTFLRSL